VHGKDLLAAAAVRGGHLDLAVQAAGAGDRRVQHVGPVGGRDHDDVGGVEAVHLGQERDQGRLGLDVGYLALLAAAARDRVHLVDGDNGPIVRAGGCEQRPDALGPDPDILLHEV
jgi:hypothetical protein